MDKLMESDAFVKGIITGISLHQQKVVAAHRRKEPVKIADELFYIQSGRERLQEMLEKYGK